MDLRFNHDGTNCSNGTDTALHRRTFSVSCSGLSVILVNVHDDGDDDDDVDGSIQSVRNDSL